MKNKKNIIYLFLKDFNKRYKSNKSKNFMESKWRPKIKYKKLLRMKTKKN